MRKKYKPAAAAIIFGAILLCPLVASLASPGVPTPVNVIHGGSIRAAGTSSQFYNATGLTVGGLNITCNNTVVDRLNRAVGFTVDAASMLAQPGGWDRLVWGDSIYGCDLNITFPNGTSSFLLTQRGGAQTFFSFTWMTNVSIPVGNYTVRANIWNENASYTGGFDFNPVTKVIVYNITPIGSIVLLNATESSTINRNQTLAFLISIFDPETHFVNLNWNVSLFKFNGTQVPEQPVKTWTKADTLNQTYRFTSLLGEDVVGGYIFYINISDASGGYSEQTVSPFTVLNNAPVIHSASYNFTSDLKRLKETMHFKVNVTDADNLVNDTYVVAILQHEPTKFDPLPVNETSEVAFVYDPMTKNFTGNLTVSKTFPIGNAKIIIKATDNDPHPATGYFIPPRDNVTKVIYNSPVVHGVTVNGRSLAAGLRFAIYNNLDFAVNASDAEDNIYSVQVTLDGPNDENVTYFILGPPPYAVRITTAALSPGSWGVFITVVDVEGGSSGSINAGIIEVDPDLRDLTGYIIGGILLVIAGFVIGGLVIWRYANERISAIRRDMVIKAKSKDGQEAKKGKPGEKGAPSKYVELPAFSKAEPEPKPEPKPASKPAEKPAASRPFTGAQAPSAKGKQPAPEKKNDGSKPKTK